MLELDSRICHVTFSHTDCADIWPAYFGETRKYFKNNMKHFLCVDKISEAIPKDVTPLIYDSSKPYPQRLLSCLKQLKDYDFIFFDHEDMFLYSEPNFDVLKSYYDVMKSGALDHIRLIKGGRNFSWSFKGIPSLHRMLRFSPWIFSIQPSFWRKDFYMQVLQGNLDCNIWELEVRSQKVVKKLKIRAAYSHSEGKKRGLYHYDNRVYPFIATAIGKGKWNFSEYSEELGLVFEKYGIDKNIRGYT